MYTIENRNPETNDEKVLFFPTTNNDNVQSLIEGKKQTKFKITNQINKEVF